MDLDTILTLYEKTVPGRRGTDLPEPDVPLADLPAAELRADCGLPELSQLEVVRHYLALSHRNFGVDSGFYPLGSCTMKYNPKVNEEIARLPAFAEAHPLQDSDTVQGSLAVVFELQRWLAEIAGFAAASLQPAAGAQGEFTGLLMIRAYHRERGEASRHRILIPDSAHGTNPASVTLGGYQTVTVPSDARGCVDLAALRSVLDTDVAGIMLTNPNTLGLFEEDIEAIAAAIHEVGGLLYYDGANLNAILGVVRPGDMGFDIVHMNLHKTFATPHGGGGPGAGPVAVSERLVPFLPGPRAVRLASDDQAPVYGWATPERSIGRMHTWHGNALVLARALAYILANGGDGLRRIAETAVLNANWIRQRLAGTYDVPFDRPCMHEVVLSVRTIKQAHGVRALDVAKRLLEEGFHAPTVYFPLIVDEALMIEPTETESPQTLEALAESLERIAHEAATEPEGTMAEFPHHTPVRRVDEGRAARTLIPTFDARR
jgi:glycine dehydrogenase subunit 2